MSADVQLVNNKKDYRSSMGVKQAWQGIKYGRAISFFSPTEWDLLLTRGFEDPKNGAADKTHFIEGRTNSSALQLRYWYEHVCGIALTWGFPSAAFGCFVQKLPHAGSEAKSKDERTKEGCTRCHGDSLNAQSTRRTAAWVMTRLTAVTGRAVLAVWQARRRAHRSPCRGNMVGEWGGAKLSITNHSFVPNQFHRCWWLC